MPGDGGGGFILPTINERQSTQYFIKGILSIRDNTGTNIGGITSISYHLQWLKDVLKY